jgi:hypothetical protein
LPSTAKIDSSKKSAALPDVSAAKEGGNGPDRDEALFMMGQFLAADAKVKEARDGRKRLRNQAKLRGFDLEQFDLAIAEREREDGTTLDNLKLFKRYCEFLGLPIGSQLKLFNSPAEGDGFSQQSVNERARQAGYELGVMAKDPDEQAYPPMTPEGQEHMAGWHEGHKVNLDKFQRLNVELAAADEAKKAKAAKKAEKYPREDIRDDETKH